MLLNLKSAITISTLALISSAPNYSSGCKEGDMMCSKTGGFLTCNFNQWVYRDCGPQTTCQMIAENHPICNYSANPPAANNYPPAYSQQPSYPSPPAQPYTQNQQPYVPEQSGQTQQYNPYK